MSKRNWPKYNQDVVKRGSVTFLVDQEALLHLLLILKIQYRLSYLEPWKGFPSRSFL